jgi:hypothetical protein
MWNAIPFILLLAVCPLAMLFMMRGIHGGTDRDTSARDARIAELEAQVASLRNGQQRDALLMDTAEQLDSHMQQASVIALPSASTEPSAPIGGR